MLSRASKPDANLNKGAKAQGRIAILCTIPSLLIIYWWGCTYQYRAMLPIPGVEAVPPCVAPIKPHIPQKMEKQTSCSAQLLHSSKDGKTKTSCSAQLLHSLLIVRMEPLTIPTKRLVRQRSLSAKSRRTPRGRSTSCESFLDVVLVFDIRISEAGLEDG